MFKLVAVGGKLRGKEFKLEEGENTFGRSMEATHQLQVNGISKNHFSITVNKDSCFLEDLGSSNGTFINGKLTKSATIKSQDKIAVPNVIFQLVYVKEKKILIKKKVAKVEQGAEDSLVLNDVMPNDFLGKIKYIFKNKVMSVIYSFNEQYEWNTLLAILLFFFICTNIMLTIGPVLLDSRKLLVSEIVARGGQYADEVARFNRIPLSRGNLEQLQTQFLDNAEGVESYELFDFEGRIVRPVSKLNSYVSDTFSVKVFNEIKQRGEDSIRKPIFEYTGNDNEIGIGKAILATNAMTGKEEPVGIIAIKFRPKTLAAEAANSTASYLEALIITCIVGVFFFGVIYYLTTKPLLEIRIHLEEVLRGKRKEIEVKSMFEELNPLKNSVNSLLQRVKELQNEDSGEFAEIEDDTKYVRQLYEFMQGSQGPVMILNSEKLIEHLNPEAEDLTGMRENTASGTSLLDSARDQGFAATVIDLCDQSANNEGTSQSEIYELTGKNYSIFVSSLMGKDNFAKAFYITFVLDE